MKQARTALAVLLLAVLIPVGATADSHSTSVPTLEAHEALEARVDALEDRVADLEAQREPEPTPDPTEAPTPEPTEPTAEPTEGPDPEPEPDPDLAACDVTVPASQDLIDEADPGDTVCLESGARGRLRVFGVVGTADAPVTIRNEGGVVEIEASGDDYAGIEIEDSAHLRITGSGVEERCGARFPEADQACGIRVAGSFNGITGKVQTHHLTIDHVEVSDTGDSGIGVYDDSVSRGGWIQQDIAFRDLYLHDLTDEGHYHGSSDYIDGETSLLDGVEITRNLIVRTGRDGIQVGSTPWNCVLKGNVVRENGLNGESSHAFGIVINRGSSCDIEGNIVVDSAGDGIYDQGLHGQRIVNNVVIRPGRLAAGDGLDIREGNQSASNPETPDYPRSTNVWHNTIVDATGSGIEFRNAAGTDNHISNNIVIGPTDRAVAFSNGAAATQQGNVFRTNALLFVNPLSDDYRLSPSSIAAHAGVPSPVTHDLRGCPRDPETPSAGAYEDAC